MTRDLTAWGLLLGLLALTTALAFVELGPWNLVLALGIAGAKASVVAQVFMRLDRAGALIRMTVAAGLLWLAIMVGLTIYTS